MRMFPVFDKVNGSGEYILGSRETGSHACYLIYGVLAPGEQGRELMPGKGHEEIVLAVDGDLKLTGDYSGTLEQGRALHLRGEQRLVAGNDSTVPVSYVVSGGHSGHGHH